MSAETRSTSAASSTRSYNITKTEEQWKKQLGAFKYKILREQGTERAGSHEYDKMYPSDGYFKCGACNYPLYTAGSKFKTGCGWPCFDKVVYSKEGGCHVGVRPHDGMFEIVCNNCGGHLGHVFYGEGCTETNERH
mmetsp:Transcript_121375/g.259149  ORF Transcript_121375/g.259149 Transcript_121375/m.259149 type:complete len:136 (-) Transcript_121375:235-642(-)